jgi:serine/threonine-protein kinase RsbW
MAVKSRTEMEARPGAIQIHLAARAENVALVRHALAGAAESLGMTEEVLADLKTVVTEACMNVVVHAYGDEVGPMEIQAWAEDGEFVVVVRDFGSGIRPRADSQDHNSLKLGISLIAAMTSGFEISGGSGRGTTIKMHLPLNGAEPVADMEAPEPISLQDQQTVVLTTWNGTTLPAVLARIVSVLASRRDMGVDELADAVLFSDVISNDLASLDSQGAVRLSLSAGDFGISLRIGPLESGIADDLRKGLYLPAEIGGSLEALADEISVDENGEGEFLNVVFG